MTQEKAGHSQHDHRSRNAYPLAYAYLGLGRGHVSVPHTGAMSGARGGLRLALLRRLANAEPANRLVNELVRFGLVERVERDILDASKLVLHRFRDVALLEVNR